MFVPTYLPYCQPVWMPGADSVFQVLAARTNTIFTAEQCDVTLCIILHGSCIMFYTCIFFPPVSLITASWWVSRELSTQVPAWPVPTVHPAAHRHQQHRLRWLLGGHPPAWYFPTSSLRQHQEWRQSGTVVFPFQPRFIL